MIVTSILLYYSIAFSLILSVTVFTLWQNKRDADAAFQRATAELQSFSNTPQPQQALESMTLEQLAAIFAQVTKDYLAKVAKDYHEKPASRAQIVSNFVGICEELKRAG